MNELMQYDNSLLDPAFQAQNSAFLEVWTPNGLITDLKLQQRQIVTRRGYAKHGRKLPSMRDQEWKEDVLKGPENALTLRHEY
jgi:hypothetical protein